MATYYRWQKSTVSYTDEITTLEFKEFDAIVDESRNITVYYSNSKPSIIDGKYFLGVYREIEVNTGWNPGGNMFLNVDQQSEVCYTNVSSITTSYSSVTLTGSIQEYKVKAGPDTSQGYIYSTSSSAYPNGGVSGSYYYDQRTTVTSPTKASNLTYPKTIDALTQTSIQLQWTGAQSNTDYPVTEYEVSYAINNTNSWQVAGTTGVLTYKFSNIPEEATSIAFRVRAKDSNNKYGDYITGTYSTITRESPITVVTKNIEMNYFNGTDYEILYPVVGSEVYNHVKSGNYVGSGQYGQSNPNKLTLEFTPKVAMITKTSGVYDTYLLNGKTVSYVQSSTGVSEITVEWTGQTVSWYSADSVEAQLNENGVLYVYTVFG